MSRLPRMVTSQRGMLSRKPMLSMASTSSPGKVAVVSTATPTLPMTVCTTPPQMSKMAFIRSMP